MTRNHFSTFFCVRAVSRWHLERTPKFRESSHAHHAHQHIHAEIVTGRGKASAVTLRSVRAADFRDVAWSAATDYDERDETRIILTKMM